LANSAVHWQIITQDPGKHSNFYADVFGWNILSDNAPGYRMVPNGAVKGLGVVSGSHLRRTGVDTALHSGRSIANTIKRIREAGGDVVILAQTLPDGDQMAILRDPMGISFGVVVLAKR
jgi:predicted enzyme related to lactoylglutathione lyase